jgi:hypothetical protein
MNRNNTYNDLCLESQIVFCTFICASIVDLFLLNPNSFGDKYELMSENRLRVLKICFSNSLLSGGNRQICLLYEK